MGKDNDKYILNDNFLRELLRMCFRRKEVLDSCILNLKYHYIPSEPYKEIFSAIKNHYKANNEIPSFGTIYQTIQSTLGKKASVTLNILTEIRDASVVDSVEILKKFEVFIRDSMSVEFFNEFAEKYKAGDRDGARLLLQSSSEKIHNFSVFRGTSVFEPVFQGFESRHEDRSITTFSGYNYKVPFSIDEIDQLSNGGADPTDMFCMVMRSGVGKTKFLRHVAVGTVRRGMNVLHLQAEGSKAACLNGYDATWTACLMSNIKKGSIPEDKYSSLKKVVSNIKSKGSDIYVHAFEQFGGASTADIDSLATDLLKQVDHIHLIQGDYLELFKPSNNIRYSPNDERHRRLAVANDCKNIAVKFNSVFGTCTQANDIPKKLLDDPEFYMTRSNVSECKGLVNPFSFYFTGNQISDEYKDGRMRIYIDKMRDYKAGQIINIYNAYKYDRFYDRKKTLQALSEATKEE